MSYKFNDSAQQHRRNTGEYQRRQQLDSVPGDIYIAT